MTKVVQVELSLDELRYIISCGAALAQNIRSDAVVTYCGFDIPQIVAFSRRMREKLDAAGEDM